ncbi:anthranilate synthase component I [Paracoccaceae bacterium]|nr:anthranilate synthase component I [Paracoccaceae bacterium]
MELTPQYKDFEKNYQNGINQLVYCRLAADLDTPVSLMMKLTNEEENSFILESVTGGEIRGRYSIIGMRPDKIWKCLGNENYIKIINDDGSGVFEKQDEDPLTGLRKLLSDSYIDIPKNLPQSSAGIFGYLGYDTIRLVENLPNLNPDPIGLPDGIFLRPSLVAVLDGAKGEVILVAPAWHHDGSDAKKLYENASKLINSAIIKLEKELAETRDLGNPKNINPPVSNFSKADYLKAVAKAKEYISAGDIFQVVPSQRWSQDFNLPPFSLYRSLRRTNPSPFMFFFNFGDFQIIGASPEILVRVFDNQITIRPIAGTRPRGKTVEQDKALEIELLNDKKELAEHLMLLDLGRNDVGRVSKVGTVTPTEEFIIERYSHVMHIVSNVVGELAPEYDALSAFFAGMPAGTVSGAPKVRAMEIIDELEPEKRGVYGGGVGYFSAAGDMDMCIALRTAILKNQKLYIQAGGGVVYDSTPEDEYMETVHKSNAIRRAAADAGIFATSKD